MGELGLQDTIECPEGIIQDVRSVCTDCAVREELSITSLAQIDDISENILATAQGFPTWGAIASTLGYTITLVMHEICMNAVEHGVLEITSCAKKELISELNENYLGYITQQWEKNGKPVLMQWCVGANTVSVAVYDGGPGFDHEARMKAPVRDEDLMESCGRGLVILRGMPVKMEYNQKGNGVSCVIRQEDLLKRLAERKKAR